MLISIAGGLLGSVLAMWSFQWLVALAVPALVPPELPMSPAWDLSPNLLVVSFASALTFGTGILFGLVPSLHVSSSSPHAFTKQDSAAAGSGRRGGRLRAALVGVQVALCMVLMIAAGLLLRGLYATYTIDLGYDYREVAVVSLESAVDLSPEDFEALRQRLIAAVETMPGVVAVASADQDPLGDDFAPVAIRLPGESEHTARHGEAITVTARYFSVLGLPIVRGRAFTDADVRRLQTGARSAIVSETTARNLWPGAEPIGRLLLSDKDTLQVVGIAADAQVNAIGYVDPYQIYVPGTGSVLLIKSRNDFGTTASGIRAIVRSIDPSLVLTVLPLAANLGWWRGISSTVTSLATGLGVLALVLATVGVYGVVSYAVTGRYREIGVRLALGATARNVLAMILRQTMRPVVVGASMGIIAATAISRVLTSVLFGVSPVDPIGLGGGALLVISLALAAGFVAARPATRADPTTTLRYE